MQDQLSLSLQDHLVAKLITLDNLVSKHSQEPVYGDHHNRKVMMKLLLFFWRIDLWKQKQHQQQLLTCFNVTCEFLAPPNNHFQKERPQFWSSVFLAKYIIYGKNHKAYSYSK